MNSLLAIFLQYRDRKAFQWNANHPLADSTGYIVYILNILGVGGPCTERSKLNTFEHVREERALVREVGLRP